MPTYEYRCQKGHDFEVLQRMSDDPVIQCEVCGAPVQRVFSAPAVHFKGTGFYSTDYGSKSRAREKENGADSSQSDSSKPESSSSKSEGSSSDSASSDTKDSKKAGAAAASD